MQPNQVKRSSDNLEQCTSGGSNGDVDDVGGSDDDSAQLSKRTRTDDVDENVSSNGISVDPSSNGQLLERAETLPLQDQRHLFNVFRSSTKSSSFAQVFNRTTSIEADIDEMNRGPKAKIINDR